MNAPAKGIPLELGIGAQSHKTTMMGLPGSERSLMISLAIWIQYMNVTDKHTDGWTPDDSKDCAYA